MQVLGLILIKSLKDCFEVTYYLVPPYSLVPPYLGILRTLHLPRISLESLEGPSGL